MVLGCKLEKRTLFPARRRQAASGKCDPPVGAVKHALPGKEEYGDADGAARRPYLLSPCLLSGRGRFNRIKSDLFYRNQ